MSFLQPLILIGLPLALIPIIIHLLNRLRYRSVSWGAIMFVLKASRSSTSMARVRQWLILLLRMLAVALLVIAVARPLLGGWLGWRFSKAPDTVIILLDRSATMGLSYADGNDCLMQALKLVCNTGKTTAADARIILVDSVAMDPKQIPAWDVLPDLNDTKITQTAAGIPALFRVALDYLLNNVTGVTEIWCLSDMQKSNWNPENSEWFELESKFKSLSQPVTFRVLAVQSNKKRNRSLSLVRLVNYTSADKKDVWDLVFDIISDEQSGESELPLVIFNNEAKGQTNVKINGQNSRLRHSLGESPKDGKCSFGYIELPPDPNLQDNRCYFAYQKLKQEKVAIVCDNKLLGETLAAAVYPEAGNVNDKISILSHFQIKDLNLQNIGFLIWVGDFPQGETADALKRYFESGGVALFFPSGSSAGGTSDQTTYQWGKTADFPADKIPKVIDWDHASGPLGDTVSGSQLSVESLTTLRRSILHSYMDNATAVYDDGKPFLYRMAVEKKGTLYFCSTLPLPNWSNLGEGIVLVPMLQRMMKEGFRRFSNISFVQCGDSGINNKLLYESVCSSGTGNNETADSPSSKTGVYIADGKFIVVNRPKIEDVRGRIDKETVTTLFKDRRIYMFDESNENDSALQTEVWRWFLMAMFCFLIAESFLLTPKKIEEDD